MTRSSLPIAVALAASAGLLLTACGGGGSDSSDKIQPTETVTTAAPSATTASPTQAAGPNAPKFDLPSDVKVDFKGFDDSDPTKKAVLTDATYAAQAVLEIEVKAHSKVTPNFSRFWTGDRGAAFADSLLAQIKGKGGITGTYHYYNPVVKTLANGGGNLSVAYCEDQRKAYSKDSTTGQAKMTTPSATDFRQWTLLMTKSSSGEWTVFDHQWLKGAKQCQVA
ncbi:hypothetical protein [Streptomyces sp. NPDC008139]|uniref:hypothetical protein n=1 Tax=Streptomyces sp. NPDC008139 TaxID=3364814 RepID=UPI0036E6D6D0